MSDQVMEDKNLKTRKNHAQNFTALKEKIEQRRKKVYYMDLQGYSNQEMAEKLGVSLSTIEKDLHHMRYYCLKWSKEFQEADRFIPMIDAKNQLELVQKELWSMFRTEKNVTVRKNILDSIVKSSEKRSKILDNRKKGFSPRIGEKMELLEHEMLQDLNK